MDLALILGRLSTLICDQKLPYVTGSVPLCVICLRALTLYTVCIQVIIQCFTYYIYREYSSHQGLLFYQYAGVPRKFVSLTYGSSIPTPPITCWSLERNFALSHQGLKFCSNTGVPSWGFHSFQSFVHHFPRYKQEVNIWKRLQCWYYNSIVGVLLKIMLTRGEMQSNYRCCPLTLTNCRIVCFLLSS